MYVRRTYSHASLTLTFSFFSFQHLDKNLRLYHSTSSFRSTAVMPTSRAPTRLTTGPHNAQKPNKVGRRSCSDAQSSSSSRTSTTLESQARFAAVSPADSYPSISSPTTPVHILHSDARGRINPPFTGSPQSISAGLPCTPGQHAYERTYGGLACGLFCLL